jgi:hypothetical protein
MLCWRVSKSFANIDIRTDAFYLPNIIQSTKMRITESVPDFSSSFPLQDSPANVGVQLWYFGEQTPPAHLSGSSSIVWWEKPDA